MPLNLGCSVAGDVVSILASVFAGFGCGARKITNCVSLSRPYCVSSKRHLGFIPVPKRRIPIQPERERAIGARVREARERLRHGQSALARALGLSAQKLRFIESGRTPLRYSIAWTLRQNFHVSLAWLASENANNMAQSDWWDWPSPNSAEAPASAYLSEVYAQAIKKPVVRPVRENFPLDIQRRHLLWESLQNDIALAVGNLTADSLVPFRDALVSAIRQLEAQLPRLPEAVADEIAKELAAAKARDAAASKELPPEAPAEPPVKPPLPARRRRAPRA
jgi:transcriptional regulator with XRE-family HTH domain